MPRLVSATPRAVRFFVSMTTILRWSARTRSAVRPTISPMRAPESEDGFLFLTSRGDQHASLRGLIST
ncbi:MAG: hypothetical protein OXH59_20335 [Rhodospirillaceae bacterium]|nr:hypothetical protein [Rhodospirillaceae bacterium]